MRPTGSDGATVRVREEQRRLSSVAAIYATAYGLASGRSFGGGGHGADQEEFFIIQSRPPRGGASGSLHLQDVG